jgi:hypothetical protein
LLAVARISYQAIHLLMGQASSANHLDFREPSGFFSHVKSDKTKLAQFGDLWQIANPFAFTPEKCAKYSLVNRLIDSDQINLGTALEPVVSTGFRLQQISIGTGRGRKREQTRDRQTNRSRLRDDGDRSQRT